MAYNPDYATHELYFVRFLYANYSGSPGMIYKGFLQSTLLVRVRALPCQYNTYYSRSFKTYKHIFTSSSSALKHVGEDGMSPEQPHKRQRTSTSKPPTKNNVAQLLELNYVTPCSIAYAAVMVSA